MTLHVTLPSQKRRHSYSSARAFAAKPVVSPPAHSTSSLKRSGSLSGSHKSSSSDLTDNGGGARTGKRITKFLRSIKRKKSSLTSAHTAGASTSSEPEFQVSTLQAKILHAVNIIAILTALLYVTCQPIPLREVMMMC